MPTLLHIGTLLTKFPEPPLSSVPEIPYYLLQEDDFKIELEDSSGFLLLQS